MKSQISVPLIPGDVSYLDVLTVIVKLWTSIDLKLQSPQSVFGITFFFSSLPSGSVGLVVTSHQDDHSTYNY